MREEHTYYGSDCQVVAEILTYLSYARYLLSGVPTTLKTLALVLPLPATTSPTSNCSNSAGGIRPMSPLCADMCLASCLVVLCLSCGSL